MYWKSVTVSLALALLLICLVKLNNGESIRFSLSAKYLPEMDMGGYNDPYVNIYAKDFYARHFRKVAQTRIQHGSQSPKWPEIFDYYFIKGAGQKLKFMIRDWDFGWNQDDDLGRVELFVEDLVNEIHKIQNSTKQRSDDQANPPPNSIKLHLMKPRGGVLIVTPIRANGTQYNAAAFNVKSNKKAKDQNQEFDLTK